MTAGATAGAGQGDNGLALRPLARVVIRSALLDIGVSIGVFLLLQGRIGAAGALAVGAGWTATRFVWLLVRHRRVEPLAGLTSVAVAVSVLVYLATNDAVALKLHEAALSGVLAVASLIAAALDLPMGGVIRRLAPDSMSLPDNDTPQRQRRLRGAVALQGLTLAVHCASSIALALTLPLARFVVVSKFVGFPILIVGYAGIVVYLRRAGH